MQKVQVTPNGIRRHLNRYRAKHAIAEFIWNGFDADAHTVELIFKANEIGHIQELNVRDDGHGINAKKLSNKFRPFLESEKEIDPGAPRITSDIHGKNGVGRLTFFAFAIGANWETIYSERGKRFHYEISIKAKDLDAYIASKPVETVNQTGTLCTFEGIFGLTTFNLEGEIFDYLSREFGWYLELNRNKKTLLINGEPFDYSRIVAERENTKFNLDGSSFELEYVRWNQKLNDEYSRYYFLDSNLNEKGTFTTTLNNKGDHFFHSVFIKSDFFNRFHRPSNLSQSLFKELPEEQLYRELLGKVESFLKQKRKPFLKEMVNIVIEDLENTDAFPDFGNNEWDKIREDGLKSVIGELFQIEPKFFSDLNTQQKKTFVHLLNLVMDSGERDALMNIIEQVVSLTPEERKHLEQTLQVTSLSNVIKTIKLIEDRYKVVGELKELVFNKSLKAKEVPHLQNVIENHYWIFGEQYHLVSAAEPKFEEALRRFIRLVRDRETDAKIDHPHKLGEMDIFMVRQQMINSNQMIQNVCVELKHPNVNLGKKQLSRIEEYRDVVLSSDEFNGKNIFWEFHLVGNGYDGSDYIQRALENSKVHGERSLTSSITNCKIYAKTWSEVFAEFELRHNFLYEKLRIERDKLASENRSADNIVSALELNSAAN